VTRVDLTDELADIVFSLPINTPAGPIQTAFGFHLVLVDKIKPGSEADFDEVREQIASTLIAEQAIDLVYDYANQLEDSLGAGANLTEAAAQLNIDVGQIENIDRNGRDIDGNQVTNSFGDLATDSLFLQLAWELELDAVSTVVETVDDSFFVVHPVAEADSRSRSFDEIKDRLKADWTREQALKAARAEAEVVMADVDKYFTNQPASLPFQRSGSGLDHAAAGLIAKAAFSQAVGQAQLVETGESIIVVRTNTVTPAPKEEQSDMSETMQAGLNRLVKADIASAFALALSETYQLELNPSLVQQVLVGQAGQ
jgi:peptidyl-prolyl cis-trans isomerase D